MAEDVTANAAGAASVEDLQAVIASQQAELEELRTRIAGPATSRRSLLKGAGVVAGGLAALGAVQATTGGLAKPELAGAVEGHNVKYGNPLKVFATIVGQKSGAIKGGVTQKGREGQIACHYFQHKVASPIDPASGLPTGQRRYDTIVLRKEFDKATPLLTRALINNENLTVGLDFWQVSPVGAEIKYFEIDLVAARLTSQNWWSPDSLQAGTGAGGDLPMEELELTFQQITWTWVDGAIVAQDDWGSSGI